MWKEVLFDIKDWQKLINEIDKIDQIMMFEDQSKLGKITSLKEDIQFFKDNIEKIYTNCLDTDYIRIKQSWVEVKNPSRKNMEGIYIDKIQNIIKTLNLSIQEVVEDSNTDSKEKIVIIRPKKIKRVLFVILLIMLFNLLFAFYKYYSVLIERLQ